MICSTLTIHAHNKFKTVINKTAPNLTDKALKFCRSIANGNKKSDAYREAYNTNNMSKENITTRELIQSITNKDSLTAVTYLPMPRHRAPDCIQKLGLY